MHSPARTWTQLQPVYDLQGEQGVQEEARKVLGEKGAESDQNAGDSVG